MAVGLMLLLWVFHR